jgi:hypothetical protein
MAEGNWKKRYQDLLQYIADHPQIEIKPQSVVMMGEDREGFYAIFEEIRRDFVREKYADELKKAEEFCKHWKEISEEVIKTLDLKGIIIEKTLNTFFEDPFECIVRFTYDPLFRAVNGTGNLETFEKESIEKIDAKLVELFREGYKRWATLGIIKLLDGDKVFCIHSPSFLDEGTKIEAFPGNDHVDVVPEPIEIKYLDFDAADACAFLTPRIVIHSKRYNRLVALRADHYYARWRSDRYSGNQEWIWFKKEIFEVFGNGDIWPDMYIYVADDIRDLKLTADLQCLCRPHVNVEFRDKDNWFTKEAVTSIKRHARATRPKCGTLILSRTAFDQGEMNEAIKPAEIDPSTMIRQYEMEVIMEKPEEPEVTPVQEENDIVVLSDDNSTVIMEEVPAAEPVAETPAPVEEPAPEEPEEEENPWGMEPDLVIKPVQLGWDISAMDEALDSLLKDIPPYPPVDW